MMRHVGILVVALSATLSTGAADARQLRRDEPNTIHDFPKLSPNTEYKSHMKDMENQDSSEKYEKLEEKYKELRGKKDKNEEGGKSEEGEKEEEKEGGKSEGGEEEETDHAGHIFAVGMMSTIVILASVFGLASSESKQVSGLTWQAIDNVVAIFIAVMYYQAFDELMDFGGIMGHHAVAAAVLHAVVLLALAIYIALLLSARSGKVQLAIFCGCVAHYVSFASMHGSKTIQEEYFSTKKGIAPRPWLLLCGLLVLLLCLAALAAVIYQIKKRRGLLEKEEWNEKVTDVENDFSAMGFAVAWSLYVRYLICGSYHKLEGEGSGVTTAFERNLMLAYGVAMLLITAFAVKSMNAVKAREGTSYTTTRVIMFFTSFFTMSVAWALILWGEWQFIQKMYAGSPITGRLFFAMICSLIAGVGIIALAYLLPESSNDSVQHSRKVALVAMSLVVGWSWELCFDAAIESLAEGSVHPAIYKVSLALGLGAVIIPVYMWFLKPYAIEKSEAAGLE